MRTIALAAAALVAACGNPTPNPTAELAAIERTRAGILADLHAEREDCKTLAIALSAEPAADRGKLVSDCIESWRDGAGPMLDMVRDMDSRARELRANTAKK